MGGEARDLLRRFSGGFSPEEMAGGDSDEIELGLSLGGCFSSQNAEKNRLVRSSSIPAMIQSDFPSVVPLIRCSSMPSEAEEEIRRRREMQSVKRMEAKRKRKEKRKFRRFEEGSVGKMGRFEGEEKGVEGSRRMGVVSQGSVASQGSSSSGGSEFESRLGQGFEFPVIFSASDANSPLNTPTTSKRNNNIAHSVSTTTSKSINDTINGVMFNANILRKNEGERSRNSRLSGAEKNMMEEMPSVSTRGSGPNGRRVDGFLYRYEQGEVSIVCVCHGRFLTPAEFVKHGGGGDVAHPLRHIVVNPSSGSFS